MIKPPTHQKWRLSIVLAFLLVRSHLCSTVANTTETDDTNQQQQPQLTSSAAGGTDTPDEKYEVIDVAAANQNGNAQTGQTLRFFTTGEVDDDFWLKHLGEDFRHAIHLQVGSGAASNDHYDDVYNTTMTEDGTTYEIRQRYTPKANANPVKENKDNDKTDHDQDQDAHEGEDYKYPTERILTEEDVGLKNNSSASKNQQQNERIEDQPPPINKNETIVESQKYEADYERVFTIDDDGGHNLAMKFYNPNSFNIPSNEKPSSQTKFKYRKYNTDQHTTDAQKDTKHTHHQHTKDGDDDSSSSSGSASKSLAPLVVTLPGNEKPIHQMDLNEKPVVVKMPPVIYHSDPQTYTQTDNTHMNTNTDTTQQHNTHTEQQQQTPQNNSPPYTQYQQQHSRQQHQRPQFPRNLYSPPPFQESTSSSSSGFNAQGVYRSLDRANASSDHAKQSLRYLLRRPPARSSPPFSSSSRVSRSSHDLYYKGL